MDSRLIFRHCGGGVITKRGRRRIAESSDGWRCAPRGGSGRQIHRVGSKPTLRGEPIPLGGSKVRDFTLPRKAAKESLLQPYLKPTQVDEVNIQRRLREHSLRN
jgi:hypothetical protein